MKCAIILVAIFIALARAQQSSMDALVAKHPRGSRLPLVHFEDQGSYFLEHEIKLNWYQAGEFCRSYGMQLVSIESMEENNFLVAQIEPRGHRVPNAYWTSGNDLGQNNTFVWSATGLKLDPYFSSWHVNEPSHFFGEKEEHCVMYFNYPANIWKWNDGSCRDEYFFICELVCDDTCRGTTAV